MARRKHGTCNTTATVQLTVGGAAHGAKVEIVNRGAVALFARADGTAAVVDADDNYVVLPSSSLIIDAIDPDVDRDVDVTLASASSCAYSAAIVDETESRRAL